MTYSLTLTITRPDNTVTFLPQDSNTRAMGESISQARKAAQGYVREERMHNQNVLEITHVWDAKDHADNFEAANRTVLEESRLAREQYFHAHNITLVVSSVEE